jgi:hypothetical protein
MHRAICHDDLHHRPCLDVFSYQPWLLQRTASELFRRSPGVIDAVDRGIKNTAMARAVRPNQAAATDASWMAAGDVAGTTNEITRLRLLLADLDLRNTVITADAIHIRDVTLAEDASQVRTGNAPESWRPSGTLWPASCADGVTPTSPIAAALRHYGRDATRVLGLLGITYP